MADAAPTSTVIVALPAANDPVHGIGDEQKHATLCFLGKDLTPEQNDAVRRVVADHVASGSKDGTLGPFAEKVTGVDSLGDDGARVWSIASDDGLADLHDELASHPVIADLMSKTDQFPSYTPHVTVGYPAEGATRLDDDTEAAANEVAGIKFDRLAVWSGPDQTEYPLAPTSEADALHAMFRGLTLDEGIPGRGNEARLKAWWIGQSGIHWGTAGDYDQCVRKATDIFGRHGVAIDPKAWCAQIHHEATGAWPGHAPGEQHESAEEAPMGDLHVSESITLAEAGTTTKSGRMRVQAISAGLGSSGYYSPAVLKEAAANRLIQRGTPLHLDHASDTERSDRPERSVQTIAAVFTSDATYDPAREALVGEIQVFSPYRERLAEMAPYIGLSISGSATDVREGQVDGKRVRIIEGLARIDSVDFVTRAGRGGQVLSVLESALAEDGHAMRISEEMAAALDPIVEAKYDAAQLRQMVKDGHAIRNADGDPSYPIGDEADLANAVKAVGRGGADHDRIRAHILKRAKALGATDMVPDDWQDPDHDGDNDATESATTSVPSTRSDESHPNTMKENLMDITESEHARLTEAAERVTVLEAERTALRADLSKAQTELTEARAALIPNKDLREALANVTRENAMLRAREVAAPIIAEALEDALIGESAAKRIAGELVDGITLKEGDEGRQVLDTAALTEAINAKVRVAEAEAQELREAMGVGKPRGLGNTGGGLLVEQKVTEYTGKTANALQAFGLSESSAKTAAQGR